VKKSPSKLKLHRETLAALSLQDLPGIAGGATVTVCGAQCPWVPFPTRNRPE
jgi:hypothetical protein